jgi:hypothetical protein
MFGGVSVWGTVRSRKSSSSRDDDKPIDWSGVGVEDLTACGALHVQLRSLDLACQEEKRYYILYTRYLSCNKSAGPATSIPDDDGDGNNNSDGNNNYSLGLLLSLLLLLRQNILHTPPDALTQTHNRLIAQPCSRLINAVVLGHGAVPHLRTRQVRCFSNRPERPLENRANDPRRVRTQVPNT